MVWYGGGGGGGCGGGGCGGGGVRMAVGWLMTRIVRFRLLRRVLWFLFGETCSKQWRRKLCTCCG